MHRREKTVWVTQRPEKVDTLLTEVEGMLPQ